jgi:hypothetical protein
MPTKKAASKEIYQLKITLTGIKPPIWRRVQVPADLTLAKLHDVIQVVMGWTNAHLHQFIIDGTYYGLRDPDFGLDDVEDERKVKLNQVVRGEKAKFTYEYDFGDSWEHALVVEKVLPPESGVKYPVCVEGKRNCPPEDCGGIWGYEEILEVLQNPKHPEYEERLEWLGGEYDPEAFDVAEVNRGLRG